MAFNGLSTDKSAAMFGIAFLRARQLLITITAWAALIYQILTEDPTLFSRVSAHSTLSRRLSPGFSTNVWTEARLKQTFERLLREFKHPAVYIIDALDQCDESAEKIIDSFTLLTTRHSQAGVKALFLNRQGPASLSLSAKVPTTIGLDLDDQSQHEDAIHIAVKQKVDELCRKRHCPQLAGVITEDLSQRSQGMYLLPFMAIRSLEKAHLTRKNIMETLDRFPDDLMAAYRQCLDNVKETHRQLVATVLLWVVFATRPLSVKELSSAVALDSTVDTSQDLELNTSVDLLGAEGVAELLGSFFRISRTEESPFVSIIHHSAREFLLRAERTSGNASTSGPPPWITNTFTSSTRPPSTTAALHSLANRTLANRCCLYYSLTSEIRDERDWLARVSLNQDEMIFWTIARKNDAMTEAVRLDDLHRELPSFRERYDPYDLRTLHVPWHRTPSASAHKFTSSQMSIIGRRRLPVSKVPGPIGNDTTSLEMPALKYCIENLPEHARLVEHSNIAFHRSFAAFLHSEVGSAWIASFWIIRDPGQAYGLQPALHFATTLGLEPEIRSLLASGVSPDSRDQFGNTALDVAASTGIVDILDLLYNIGKANIHARQMQSFDPRDEVFQKWNTVLHTAVWYGHYSATEYLLNAGAEVHIPDLNDMTPIDIAISTGNRALVQLLLNRWGEDAALFDAASRGRVETLKWLLQDNDIDTLHRSRSRLLPLLHTATSKDRAPCVEFLAPMTLKSFDDVYNSDGLHPIHIAAKTGSHKVLDLLVGGLGVDINLLARQRWSALHYACVWGKASTAVKLIDLGIDPTLRDEDGFTALDLILAGKQLECLRAQRLEVISVFSDPSTRRSRPSSGGNLLHVALQTKMRQPSWFETGQSTELAIINTLLRWGLDPGEFDSARNTALSLAAKWKDKRFLAVLDACGRIDVQDDSLCQLLQGNHGDIDLLSAIKALVEKGADVEVRDRKGRSALHYAVYQPTAILDFIIERCRTVNMPDHDGKTPLHALVESAYGRVSMLENLRTLLRSGTDIDIRDRDGKSPLDIYAENSRFRYDDVLTTLVDNGCSLIGYDDDWKAMLARNLAVDGSLNDARLVLASLGQSSPSRASPDKTLSGAAAMCNIAPEVLLEGLSEWNKASLLSFLLDEGASVSQLLPFVELVEPSYRPHRLAILCASSADRERSLRENILEAVLENDLLIVRSLVNEFPDGVKVADATNRTTLSLAAERGNLDMLEYLLSQGVDTECVDNFGRTALYWAARAGKLDAAKMLAKHGAMLTYYAVEVGALYGYEDITEWLREYTKRHAG